MNIHLDPKYEQQIENIAASTGKTADQILEEIVKAALPNLPQQDDVSTAKSQRAAIKRLQEKLRSLPVGNPDDGFDASQHDKVIYQRDC